MLSQISWTDYISTTLAIMILYYAVTFIHYFRYEIAYHFSEKNKTQPSVKIQPDQTSE